MLIYVDGSAVLRHLRGASRGAAPLTDADVVSSSDVLEIEVRRALERAWLGRLLDDDELDRKLDECTALLETLHLFPVGDEVFALSRPRFSLELGVTGSVHIATAQLIERDAGSRLQFWTHMAGTGAAAALRGLDVRGLSPRS